MSATQSATSEVGETQEKVQPIKPLTVAEISTLNKMDEGAEGSRGTGTREVNIETEYMHRLTITPYPHTAIDTVEVLPDGDKLPKWQKTLQLNTKFPRLKAPRRAGLALVTGKLGEPVGSH